MINKSIKTSLARYLSMQALYQSLESGQNLEEVLNEYNELHVSNISLDFNNSYKKFKLQADKTYFKKLIYTSSKEKELIQSLIENNLKDSWVIDRLPKVIQAIIKVAVAEMIESPKLSLAIIASEYIILTESFFSKTESSFVNALIQNIYNQLNSAKL